MPNGKTEILDNGNEGENRHVHIPGGGRVVNMRTRKYKLIQQQQNAPGINVFQVLAARYRMLHCVHENKKYT